MIRIKTVLDESLFVVSRFEGVDRVSAPFSYGLDLYSPEAHLELKQLIGQPVQLLLETDRGDRLFHGYVKEFARIGAFDAVTGYRMEITPWFDFLRYTSNCRIFQNKTVQEIVDEVFHAYSPLADYRYEIHGDILRKLDYRVQYNESDFNFISHLLEETGIYYTFEHAENQHTMVLADDSTASQPIGHVATVRYRSDDGTRMDHDLEQWCSRRRIGTDVHIVRSFDFKQPRNTLLSDYVSSVPRGMLPQLERYSYDGAARFSDSRVGDVLANVRGEAAAWPTKLFEGNGSNRHIYAGGYFQLEGHFDHREGDPAEREFFVVEVRHEASNNLDVELTDDTVARYRCTLTALRRKIPFRPLRQTPRQLILGPQTATVVGPPGEELHSDRYGRVKVQFHWDRQGTFNANSSCWIRVASPWAGSDMGGVSTPRVGQEVVVDFLDGNPDRPLIINRVYNEDNMPPFGMETSGMRSKTVKGEGYNEITMNDTAGSELLNVRAQHDMTTTVGNDKISLVGANSSTQIAGNRDQTVGGSEMRSVGSDQSESIAGNRTMTVLGNRIVTVVGASDTVANGKVSEMYNAGEVKTITDGGYRETIQGDWTTSLIGDYNSTRNGDWQQSITGQAFRRVDGLAQTSLNGGRSISIKSSDKYTVDGVVEEGSTGNWETQVGGDRMHMTAGACSVHSNGDMVVSSASKTTVGVEGALFVAEPGKITISAGGAKIVIDSSGVVINGTVIKLN